MSEKHAVSSLSKSVCIYRQISNQQMNQSPNYLSSSNKGRKYIHGPIFPNLISVNSFGNAFRHKTSTRRPLRKLPHSMPHIDHTINNSNSMASIQAVNGRQSKFLSRVIAAKLCLQYNSNIIGISVDRRTDTHAGAPAYTYTALQIVHARKMRYSIILFIF